MYAYICIFVYIYRHKYEYLKRGWHERKRADSTCPTNLIDSRRFINANYKTEGKFRLNDIRLERETVAISR